MYVKLSTLKKLTWALSLLFTVSLIAELYVLFTDLSDQMGLIQQTDIGLKMFYLTPFVVYSFSLILNRTELILIYLLVCLHCGIFNTFLATSVITGWFSLRDLNLLMTFFVFVLVQSGLALLSCSGCVLVYLRIKRAKATRNVNVLKMYAFKRFTVLCEDTE